MFAWLVLALGLALAPAHAADRGPMPVSEAEFLLQENPLDAAAKKREEEEKARAERLKALEAAQGQVAARVIVLAWGGAPDVNYEHSGLRGNITSRIARPDAKFYPDIDLYQIGRRHPDRSLSAAEQPGSVPASNIDVVMAAVEDIETIGWNDMTEADWGITANNLEGLIDQIWFVDRPELRAPLFELYVQIGRAAENMNNPVAPFYQRVGGQLVNYYWYLAGAMAYEDGKLLDLLSDQPELKSSVEYYTFLLKDKAIPFMTLSFEEGGVWNAAKFAGDYQVYINGLEVLITDTQSLYKVPPGRVDIFLKRSDGFSISDSVDLANLQDKIYFVRDVARKKMGIDLIDQLMEHPNECSPRVEGDILTGIAIYAMLHPSSEMYFAVPVAGDPNKVLLWRWDRDNKVLTKVLDATQGYPLRFALLGGVGMSFNGGKVTVDPCASTDPITQECIPGPPVTEFAPAGVPLYAQFRVHWRRLFLMFGAELMPALGEGGVSDLYQTQDGHDVVDSSGTEVVKNKKFSTLVHTGFGITLLKKAAAGIGPRIYVRFGGYDLPHTFDLTAHGGITMEPPGMDQKGRVRLILDADGYVGTLLPYGDTLLDKPALTFGLAIGAGTTF